jgi:hypothetical protein
MKFERTRQMRMGGSRKAVDFMGEVDVEIYEEHICPIIQNPIHMSEFDELRTTIICQILLVNGFLDEIKWKKKNFIMRLFWRCYDHGEIYTNKSQRLVRGRKKDWRLSRRLLENNVI